MFYVLMCRKTDCRLEEAVKEREESYMGTKIVYNHRAIEKKWRKNWEENPVNPNVNDGKKNRNITVWICSRIRREADCM